MSRIASSAATKADAPVRRREQPLATRRPEPAPDDPMPGPVGPHMPQTVIGAPSAAGSRRKIFSSHVLDAERSKTIR